MKAFIKNVLSGTPLEGFAKNKIYDLETVQVMKKVLHKDSNCVDIGCHKGGILRKMLKYAPAGQHFGFEPIPNLYEELIKSFSHLKNVFLYKTALSDNKGTSSFVYVTSNPGYSGLKERRYDKPNETRKSIKVNTERLDDIIPGDVRIDFIKIDVEGAELQVLRGGVHTIKKSKPVIVFEHGLGAADYYDTKPEEIYDLLNGECRLSVTLMEHFLNGGRTLSRKEFVEQYNKDLNYYFIAFA